jgi:type II secretory pathway component GspD/PulD (secretin)
MVLTKDGWLPLSVAINALEQNSDSDVLSAPSLTTLNGKAAEIWVGEDRAVPKAFDVNSADVNIHIEHKKWASELMGVNFKVTPEIEKDNTIRLKLNPKVLDLIGYDTYQASPKGSMIAVNGAPSGTTWVEGIFPIAKYLADGTINPVWDSMSATISAASAGTVTDVNDKNTGDTVNNASPQYRYNAKRMRADHATFGIPLKEVDGQLPYFRVREIKTTVVVADGCTVGLGGLIYDRLETYKDKIPVLGSIPLIGRLFRSEGERSIKRNLMIFVSAGQVSNDGQRKADVAINK